MNYREWKAYWKTLDWSRKWFVVFLLIRPIVDTLYFLKYFASFLSPVYIVGVLTPLLAVASVQSRKLKRPPHNGSDGLVRTWGLIIFLNSLYLLSWSYSFNGLGDNIKYITPPLMFLYLRKFIRNKEDLRFILTTFLASCIVPFGMLAFELFVHPLSPEYVSEGRGGGSRLRGNFADSVSYGIYFVGAFIVMCYFFLDKVYSRIKQKKPTLKMFMVFLFCAAGIASLRHVSTWSVFLITIGWFLFYNAQNIRGLTVVVVIGLIVLPIFAVPVYNNYIAPLLQKEINVMEGNADIQYGLNGRVSRWERYFEVWDQMPVFAQMFGVSFSNFKEAPIMIGGGMHSDYVRMIFLSGVVGAVIYVFFLLTLLINTKKLQKPERFLFLAIYSALTLYSVSTLPLLYLPFLNYVFPVLCFTMLPSKAMYTTPPVRTVQPRNPIPLHPIPEVV